MDTLTTTKLDYQSGFGNEFSTEALPGALPKGQNSPQKAPYNLYAELLSGTAFTAPRVDNLRSWVYRLRPSAGHPPFQQIDKGLLRTAPFDEADTPPDQLRWDPLPIPDAPTDFVEGLVTLGGNGDVMSQTGIGIHVYTANKSMDHRTIYNGDGEMLFVPQQGRLSIKTEMGVLEVLPNQIAVVPRGIKFRIDLPDGPSRGYVCENYGKALELPGLGPIGSNGLANARDFHSPVAAFEDDDSPHQLLCKFGGNLWATEVEHSPLDVVAWHGNLTPYKYDLADFNVIGSTSYDHPDPSIFTVLTSVSGTPGTANVDFVIFPPRWLVQEHTFRPPWYHRNVMSEFMGLIHGVYDAKAEGFIPGGGSLHNSWAAHGPDAETYEKAVNANLKPQFVGETMAFMFETRYIVRPTKFALESDSLQADYYQCWQGIPKNFNGSM